MNSEPAFPQVYDAHHWPGGNEPKGMSLLDYFAAHAMQGLLARSGSQIPTDKYLAMESYITAEAMLKERALRSLDAVKDGVA